MTVNLQYYKPSRLIPSILVLALILTVPLELYIDPLYQHIPLINSLGAPSVAGIILFILYVYDRHLWKTRVGQWWVNIPNISGKYIGYVRYDYNGKEERKNVILNVFQTASQITISSEFSFDDGRKEQNTRSVSTVSNLSKRDEFYHLEYLYRNEGDKIGTDSMMHEGHASMRYDQEEKKLIGHYFTGRLSKGVIEVSHHI